MLQYLDAHDGKRLTKALVLEIFLSEFALFFQRHQPGSVELVPESNALIVQIVVVARQTCNWELAQLEIATMVA